MDSKLPYIVCHMMVSIDGKITAGKIQGQTVQDSTFDNFMNYYTSTEGSYKPKAVMCGRVTMEQFAESVGTPIQADLAAYDNLNEDFIMNDKTNYFIAIDTKGLLRWKDDFVVLTSGGEQKEFSLIIVVDNNTPKEYLAYLRSKNISYVFGGESELNFKLLFGKLRGKFNLDQLIIEGGGSMNGSVVDEDLINEISILYLPVIINNINAPTAFYKDIKELKIHKYKIKSLEKLDDSVIWARYSKVDNLE